jgi:PAS domain S-box-containing protein
LAPREDHYRLIADSIPAVITFMTPAGEVESVNRHVLEYFGATLEELKGGDERVCSSGVIFRGCLLRGGEP